GQSLRAPPRHPVRHRAASAPHAAHHHLGRSRRADALGRGRRRWEVFVSDDISIQFTRFSAFYSPLIATIAAGFLEQEGLRPTHPAPAAATSAIAGLKNGSVHVCQSAPSQGFGPLEKGQTPPAVHFAQINEKDGFFLTARAADPAFSWDTLRGKRVLVDHGGQPLAMFKYACHHPALALPTLQPSHLPT